MSAVNISPEFGNTQDSQIHSYGRRLGVDDLSQEAPDLCIGIRRHKRAVILIVVNMGIAGQLRREQNECGLAFLGSMRWTRDNWPTLSSAAHVAELPWQPGHLDSRLT